MTPIKGSIHIVVTREFAKFVLEDYRAQDLLEWVKPQYVADESYFATLAHNPQLGIPGSFMGELWSDFVMLTIQKTWVAVYQEQ